ncbi:signal peptidase II [Yunchengibacter salinarum]|uniref:signal peptidase II n=1 Tax=Yunchengibacter salinarum TaxID=3133399 RepID=UPI0035B6A5BB
MAMPDPAPGPARPAHWRRRALALAGAVFVLDQLVKWGVLAGLDLATRGRLSLLPFLDFTLVWNRGISMNLPLGDLVGRAGLIGLTLLVVIWLLRWLWRSQRPVEALALGAVVGGALGNVLDRVIHGAVVDFVHLHAFDYHFYVFNVADAAITLGVAALLVDGLRDRAKTPTNPERPSSGTNGADTHSNRKGGASRDQ